MRRDVFQAIADPRRRAILDLLATGKLTLNSVADRFDVSRPAISRHMKILSECGLVRFERRGRLRYCNANMRRLNEVSRWVDQYRAFWQGKLDALEAYLSNADAPHRTAPTKRRRQK
ncbi:MAG TPA: metalloregulator ArsR/SmtB family transcription factor [Bacteroidota bacterium]|nr:metalloregulator ArsR/SmtB family transcription factor [Bacteroidota bacterium]